MNSRFAMSLAMVGVMLSGSAFAEEDMPANDGNDRALADLCATYAEEDGIAAKERGEYLAECMAGMTDLSESIQEDQPVVADAVRSPDTAIPPARESSTPEQMVQNEVVSEPDPSAEQLNAKP